MCHSGRVTLDKPLALSELLGKPGCRPAGEPVEDPALRPQRAGRMWLPLEAWPPAPGGLARAGPRFADFPRDIPRLNCGFPDRLVFPLSSITTQCLAGYANIAPTPQGTPKLQRPSQSELRYPRWMLGGRHQVSLWPPLTQHLTLKQPLQCPHRQAGAPWRGSSRASPPPPGSVCTKPVWPHPHATSPDAEKPGLRMGIQPHLYPPGAPSNPRLLLGKNSQLQRIKGCPEGS